MRTGNKPTWMMGHPWGRVWRWVGVRRTCLEWLPAVFYQKEWDLLLNDIWMQLGTVDYTFFPPATPYSPPTLANIMLPYSNSNPSPLQDTSHIIPWGYSHVLIIMIITRWLIICLIQKLYNNNNDNGQMSIVTPEWQRNLLMLMPDQGYQVIKVNKGSLGCANRTSLIWGMREGTTSSLTYAGVNLKCINIDENLLSIMDWRMIFYTFMV